ncbi:MAG TPA: CYTH domain-containing protein [Gemmatimonadaceae bacterium]
MATEIERKFLVREDRWRADPSQGKRYRQGYLSTDLDRVVRVRTVGDGGFLTIKGATQGISRLEFEYSIALADANEMLNRICVGPLIEKTRYRVPFEGRVWEVDVFEGDNAGLIVAEVELPSADAHVVLPPWVGAEVSGDPRYYNSNLTRHPYAEWRDRR